MLREGKGTKCPLAYGSISVELPSVTSCKRWKLSNFNFDLKLLKLFTITVPRRGL